MCTRRGREWEGGGGRVVRACTPAASRCKVSVRIHRPGCGPQRQGARVEGRGPTLGLGVRPRTAARAPQSACV
eukprot:scaffold28180_cov129-Isochrysis_galbana.AAC.3